MTKSEIFVALAGLQDADPRVAAVAAILTGHAEPERPASLRLLRPGEAAKVLGVSRCTLWRLTKENRIRTVELRRGSLCIPESELARFVEGRLPPAPQLRAKEVLPC